MKSQISVPVDTKTFKGSGGLTVNNESSIVPKNSKIRNYWFQISSFIILNSSLEKHRTRGNCKAKMQFSHSNADVLSRVNSCFSDRAHRQFYMQLQLRPYKTLLCPVSKACYLFSGTLFQKSYLIRPFSL